jgi:hypothetical protein
MEGQTADAWWKLLYAHHATLILNGHDHVYSRFALTVLPATPNLQAVLRRLQLGLPVRDGEPDRAGRHAADLQRRGLRELQRAARLLTLTMWGRRCRPHIMSVAGTAAAPTGSSAV